MENVSVKCVLLKSTEYSHGIDCNIKSKPKKKHLLKNSPSETTEDVSRSFQTPLYCAKLKDPYISQICQT